MAQLLIRNMDKRAVESLKKRAKANGHPLQSEAKMILDDNGKLDMATARKRLAQFRKRFKGRTFSDSVDLIREDRDR